MKKKPTSVLYGLFCYFCILFSCDFGYGQKRIVVKGTIVVSNSGKGLEGVLVQLKKTTSSTYTNRKGNFFLEDISKGFAVLELFLEGYISKNIPIKFKEGEELDLGKIELFEDNTKEQLFTTIAISDDELSEDEIGGSDNITGLLQASKDVFLRTAAFNFGQARFKVRGYDSREGTVLLNGVEMNKIIDGRPQWSNWGGLNTVLRNQTVSRGIAVSDNSFGGLLGVTNFSTRASEYRSGYSLSLAATNGSYKNRVMVSYFTGLQKNGWAFAISASQRSAQSATMEGTTYNAKAVFFAVEKELNAKHSLNFTFILTPNRRGKSSPNTQEVYDLRGTKYNAYWGFQEGEKRNSRLKEIVEPIFMLNHYWLKNESTTVDFSISYQFGHIGNSRLGYFNASNPDPTYYKKLPSYNLRLPGNLDYAGAFLSLKEFKRNGQIDWRNIYQTNATTQYANYYLYEDRNEDNTLALNTKIDKRINPNLNALLGISYTKLKSLNYAKVLDVFGENGFVDLDGFALGAARQNDLNNKNRTVLVGDAFSYKYEVLVSKLKLFSQVEYASNKTELTGTLGYEQTNYQRKGLFRNGAYADSSFGLGTKKSFNDFSMKGSGLYKFSGRHLLALNLGYLNKAPSIKNTFANIRSNHNFSSNLKSETKITGDFSYRYRAPGIKARFTGYYTQFSNAIENYFVFAQGLRGDASDFVGQTLTGIKKKHVGVEFGLEAQVSSSIKLTAVAAIGQFVYANNPHLYLESDQFKGVESDFGIAYLKNYRLGGTPQNAYSVGFEYRDPAYWWYSINANLLTHNYLTISPLLRTNNFFLDKDGVPFVNENTQNQISQEDVKGLLSQERFDENFLVNLVGGKSWKIKGTYLGLFASINNVLGAVYKTGGFEQSRKANYKELKEDKELELPLFGPKYWYGNGTSYYLILSVYF